MSASNTMVGSVNPSIDFCFIGSLLSINTDTGVIAPQNIEGFEHQGLDAEKSGVVIGMGLDLGNTDVDALRMLYLNPTLIGKLYPYLGKRGDEAQTYLENNPLDLSVHELNAINLGLNEKWVTKLVSMYDAKSNQPFVELDPVWQTTIACLTMVYGGLSKHWSACWQCLVNQDFAKVIKLLQEHDENHEIHQQQLNYIQQHANHL